MAPGPCESDSEFSTEPICFPHLRLRLWFLSSSSRPIIAKAGWQVASESFGEQNRGPFVRCPSNVLRQTGRAAGIALPREACGKFQSVGVRPVHRSPGSLRLALLRGGGGGDMGPAISRFWTSSDKLKLELTGVVSVREMFFRKVCQVPCLCEWS